MNTMACMLIASWINGGVKRTYSFLSLSLTKSIMSWLTLSIKSRSGVPVVCRGEGEEIQELSTCSNSSFTATACITNNLSYITMSVYPTFNSAESISLLGIIHCDIGWYRPGVRSEVKSSPWRVSGQSHSRKCWCQSPTNALGSSSGGSHRLW